MWQRHRTILDCYEKALKVIDNLEKPNTEGTRMDTKILFPFVDGRLAFRFALLHSLRSSSSFCFSLSSKDGSAPGAAFCRNV